MTISTMKKISGVALAICSLAMIGIAQAVEKSPPKPGWEYSPEEFGVGRNHTPNKKCNAEIDELLNEIRACYNKREAGKCEDLQEKNSDKVGKIKKQRRCQHKSRG